MKNILISAYACEPYKGSEQAVGWNLVQEISKYNYKVFVITRSNNKESIESFTKSSNKDNIVWVYYDLPKWLRFWKRGSRGIQIYYYLWQIGIYFLAKKIVKREKILLIHHITFVKYWIPSFLSLLNIPFIWGPVGGGESINSNFVKIFNFKGKIKYYLRNFIRFIFEHDPFLIYTAKRSSFILAATEETKKRIEKLTNKPIIVLSQIALDDKEFSKTNKYLQKNKNEFTIISIGRLLYWKGFNLGLWAFERFLRHNKHSKYIIIGEGPEKESLVKLAEKLHITQKVIFKKNLDRKEVFKYLMTSDVLLHPSLHDSGGFVIAEAMFSGLPVICLDIGGPAIQVTKDTGIKIVPFNPEQVIAELSKSLLLLANDFNLKKSMGKAGKERISKLFNWETKGRVINNIYQKLLY